MNNSLLRPGTNRTYNSLRARWITGCTHKTMDEAYLNKMAHWWLYNVGLAPRTVKILLRLLCEEGKKYGLLLDSSSVTRQVMKNVQDKPVKALTKDQSTALLDGCWGTKLYIPVLLSLHTGMRRGEVWGLSWDDIDWNKNRILVSGSYEGPTKSGKVRYVPMSGLLERTLRLQHGLIKTSHIVKDKFDPNPLLKVICKKSNIPVVNFHALRHTFATLALEAGTSPKKVQEVLGHSALSTTLNIYWSSTQEKMDLEFLK